MRHSLHAALFTSLLLLALAPAAFADETHRSGIDVDVHGEDGGHVSLSLHSELVGQIVADVAKDVMDGLEVHADLDADVRAMLRHLDREGDGARYTLRGDDGEVVKAHRHGSQLELDVRDADGDHSRVEIPWALAEVLLGHRPERSSRDGDAGLDIRVEGDDGGTVHVHVH